MLKSYIRHFKSSLKQDCYNYPIKISTNVKLPFKSKFFKKLRKIPLTVHDSGTICNECFGTGWINNNKKNFILSMNYNFTICKKCNGTGLI